MKKTVSEVAKECGISVRTLHYYDEIGLLHPAATTEAGYRLYGEKELARLSQILLFRELELPLKEVKKILDTPSFDEKEALLHHRELIALKYNRLERLIGLIDHMLKGDLCTMDAFNKSEFQEASQKFLKEAKERWGKTQAWEEYEQKNSDGEAPPHFMEEADHIFRRIAKFIGQNPATPEVQDSIRQWQAYITEHFYTCTDPVLLQLGELYISDERFARFYNSRYGEGMAEFMHDAIRYCCENE